MAKSLAKIAVFSPGGWVHDQVYLGIQRQAVHHDWILTRYFADYRMSAFEAKGYEGYILINMPWKQASAAVRSSSRVIVVGSHENPKAAQCIVPDETAVGRLAAQHLLAKRCAAYAGYANHGNEFASQRLAAFRQGIERAGGQYCSGGERWVCRNAHPLAPSVTNVLAWLASLPRPLGVFASADTWAITFLEHCRTGGIKVPENVLVIGVDDSLSAAQFAVPPLSSVALPWAAMGESALQALVNLSMNRAVAKKMIVAPCGVVERRSTEQLAFGDPLVKQAVGYIRANAHHPITLTELLRVVPASAKTLQRSFHKELGRSVMAEVRAAHVAKAQKMLRDTQLSVEEIALGSGFSSASRLSIVFTQMVGQSPGAYRRSFQTNLDFVPAAE